MNVDEILDKPISNEEISMNRLVLQLMKLRHERGYSRNQLAEATGTDSTSIDCVENFEMQPTIEMVLKILDIYEMTLGVASYAKMATSKGESRKKSKPENRQLSTEFGNARCKFENICFRGILQKVKEQVRLCTNRGNDYGLFIQSLFANYCGVLKA